MKDPRLQKLSRQLIRYSCALKKGERVLIENFGVETEFVTSLIAEAYEVGAEPIVVLRDNAIQRALMLGGTAEKWKKEAQLDGERMRQVNAYIGIRGGNNSYETADVPQDKMKLYMQHYNKPVHSEIRVPKTRWVVLRFPTPSMAQLAETSIEAFEDHYFDVCTLDYAKMSIAMDALVARMARTDKVHIVGPGTDLTFSIKGMPPIKCDGKLNIPDGEVFSAPVRDSVNGVISYNTPSLYQGSVFENTRLVFRDGKIIEATSSDTARSNAIFDTDEGARYVGEFAIGVNPYITRAIKDTLFDEKICGSFHFTPGACYDECPNGNKSAIHWDLVCIQTPAYGGGEMYFDGQLIRKDGLFVTEDLQCLNPEALK
ncbi:MAG: aminopeptidase [Clostridiales bacterium]|nr:aminopeptidase [Clostridiales bacterium]